MTDDVYDAGVERARARLAAYFAANNVPEWAQREGERVGNLLGIVLMSMGPKGSPEYKQPIIRVALMFLSEMLVEGERITAESKS